MTFTLTLLGTNAALPQLHRAPSAHVLQAGHHYYLIDCGEGTQLRLIACKIRHTRIRQIFISHLHGDHVFGLIGLLTSWQLNGRREPLEVYAPAGLAEAIEVQLRISQTSLGYPLAFHEVDTTSHQRIFSDRQVEVYSLPLVHRIPTAGFLFREIPRPDNIIPEKIEAYRIPVPAIKAIKAGGDFAAPDGRRIPHAELTRPAAPPRAYAYCSDTAYQPALAPLLHDVDLLYHEATFLEADAVYARETGHSTARQAALLAREAGARQLVLGHFSSRYDDVNAFTEEARTIFPHTIAGEDGMRLEVPYRKREQG